MIIISLLNNKEDDHKAIDIDKGLFKTDWIFNMATVVVIGLLAVIILCCGLSCWGCYKCCGGGRREETSLQPLPSGARNDDLQKIEEGQVVDAALREVHHGRRSLPRSEEQSIDRARYA